LGASAARLALIVINANATPVPVTVRKRFACVGEGLGTENQVGAVRGWGAATPTGSKSGFSRTAQSGHAQLSGIADHCVPGGNPS
jgi:hypothetical protein